MNILFLTSRFPFPPIGGDRLRPYYFIKELSKRHNIHLLSFAQDNEIKYVDEDVKKRIRISTVRHSHFISCLKVAMNFFKKEPLQVNYYYYKAMQDRFDSIIKEERIDLVFVHLIRMAKYAKNLSNLKKIIDYSDSFGLLYDRSLKIRKGIFGLIDYIEKRRIDSFEKEYLSYFDDVIVSSLIDKKYIEKGADNDKIQVITNGAEFHNNAGTISCDETLSDIAFIGNMRSFSNRKAITNFARNIFPIVKRYKRNVRLFVIGAEPPKILNKFSKDKSINITGRIENIDLYLKRCSIGIAPMISCSGVQNKILKYMALKIPTVATKIALGDLDAIPERDIIVADSNEDFAEAIISLLKDKSKQKTIGENGYNYVKTNHNLEDIINQLDNLISR